MNKTLATKITEELINVLVGQLPKKAKTQASTKKYLDVLSHQTTVLANLFLDGFSMLNKFKNDQEFNLSWNKTMVILNQEMYEYREKNKANLEQLEEDK